MKNNILRRLKFYFKRQGSSKLLRFVPLFLLCLSIGFAYVSTNLSINGTLTSKKVSWNVYFDNIQVREGSVTPDSEPEITNLTEVNYAVTLDDLGEFYEFTIDVNNKGTLDAMVNLKVVDELDPKLASYIDYSVTYNNGTPINELDKLGTGETQKIKISLKFKDDISSLDDYENVESLDLGVSLDYERATEESNEVANDPSNFETDSWATIIEAVNNKDTSRYNVGDTKKVNLGDLGTHTVRIANMSKPTECSNSGFSQTACGFVIEFADIITTHSMNSSDTNSGGYPSSELYEYLNDTIYNSLPNELKNAIIDTNNISGHNNTDTSNYTSTSKLYLLDEKEVFNTNNSTSSSNERQLDYYSENNNYIKQYEESDEYWWIRSSSNNSTSFISIKDDGTIINSNASETLGIAPAFRLSGDNCVPFIFNDQTISTKGKYKESFNASFEGASNGSGNYTYSVESVKLNGKNLTPSESTYNGLSLNNTTISGTPTKAGEYVFKIKVTDNETGEEKTSEIKVVIEKKPLTIKIENKDMSFGGTVPTYTYTIEGLVEGDDSTEITGTPTYVVKNSDGEEVEVTDSLPIGTYTITLTGLISDNYELTYEEGTLTIEHGEYQVKYNPNGGYKLELSDLDCYSTLGTGTNISSTGEPGFTEYQWTETNGVWKSGNNGHDSSASTLASNTFTVSNSATVEFEWAVSSEKNYDKLYYYLYDTNGNQIKTSNISGNSSITSEDNLTFNKIQINITNPGTYHLKFVYQKDSSQNSGLDAGYIKNVKAPVQVEGTMDNSTHSIGESNNLSKSEYSKEFPYLFAGWSTNPDATEAEYEDEEEILNLSTTNNDVVNLYAVWVLPKYTVNVVVQNGTTSTSQKQVTYMQDGTFNLTPNEGYTYSSEISCTNDQSATINGSNVLTISNVTNNTTCTVKFRGPSYQVKYNPNGGYMIPMTSTTESYPWTNTAGVWKSGGYHINNAVSTMRSKEFTIIEPTTISFDWAVSSESVSYDYLYYSIYKNGSLMSGTGNTSSSKIGGNDSITDESNLNYTTVTKALDAGTYTLEFTYKKDNSVDKGLDAGYVKNINLPIHSDTLMDNSTHEVGEESNLSLNEYINDYPYFFKGWSTNPDATTPTYLDGAEILNLSTTNGDVVDLYAIWGLPTYTATLDIHDGTADESTKSALHGNDVSFNLTPNNPNYIAVATCTNNQEATVENNVLTIEHLTANTTCTVNFKDTITTLFEDGTLIINEYLNNREDNVIEHGTVTKQYEPMSESNSYVFNSSNQLWNQEKEDILRIEIGQVIQPINTSYWFYDLVNMNYGNLTNIDTSNDISMSRMFYSSGENASTFELIGMNDWDTSNVTNMSWIFNKIGQNATEWNIGDLSNWDVSKVTNMSDMFCESGQNATIWNIGNLDNWNTQNVTDMNHMFAGTAENATEWNIGDLSNWNTQNVKDMTLMFAQTAYKNLEFNIGNLTNWDTSKVTSMYYMFGNAGRNATTWNIGDLSNWDVSSVTNMNSLFENAGSNATEWNIGDLSSWDVSKVEGMSNMFGGAGENAIEWNIGNLSDWNVSKVTDMSGMFSSAGENATNWNIGDLSNWDVSKVTSMYYMFGNAGRNATTWNIGNLSEWNVSKVTDMSGMFYYNGYNSTTWNIGDLSNWDVSNVTDMSYMFAETAFSSINAELYISNWNPINLEDTNHLFSYSRIKTIYCNYDWSALTNITNSTNMFNVAINLVGGNGTTYSSDHIDKTYARPDTTDSPGYFTTLAYYQVDVVVKNGTVNKPSKRIKNGTSTTFDLTSSIEGTYPIVSCTNNQTATITDNVLTVSNISADTTITVTYTYETTTLYSDGTLIINEDLDNRAENITEHGTVSKEYEGMSELNSYVFNYSNQLWNQEKEDILRIEIGQVIQPIDTKYWFYHLKNLSYGDFTNLDTTYVIKMYQMFSGMGCDSSSEKFELIGLDNWNVSNVTDMSEIFYKVGYNATEWTIGDLSNWDVSNVTDMSGMFDSAGYNSTTWNIGNLDNWDVSNVTDMSFMFDYTGCFTVNWSIGNLSNWDVSKVTDMYTMFGRAGYSSTIFDLDLSNWDVSNVTDMSSMFSRAGALSIYWDIGDLSNWDVSKVTSMYAMFGYDYRISDGFMNIGAAYSANNAVLKITNWNPVSVNNMRFMFANSGFKTIYCNYDWSTLDNITDDGNMFVNMTNLVGGNGTISNIFENPDNITYARPDTTDSPGYFTTATLKTVNVVVQNGTVTPTTKSVVDTATFKLTPTNSGDGLASVTCTNGQTGSVVNNKLTVSNITNDTTCTVTFAPSVTTLFNDGTLIINEAPIDRANNIIEHGAVTKQYEAMSDSNSYIFNNLSQPWNQEKEDILRIEIGQVIKPINTSYWFYDLVNMIYGNLTNIDTSNDISMSMMFCASGENASTFELIGLNDWDTSNVTNMGIMFEYAGKNATTWSIGDLSNWNVSKVTDMSYLFEQTGKNATTWDIGNLNNWDVSNVTNMNNMFYAIGKNAVTLSIGDLSNWNTSNVTNMSSMFSESSAGPSDNHGFTTNLNLTNWDVSNVTNMEDMFFGQARITSLGDLSNWDVSNVTDMSDMFIGTTRIDCISDLSNWDVSNVTNMSHMFAYAGYNANEWSIGDLSQWNTSKVTDMSSMFHEAGENANEWSIGDLSQWNISNVTNMSRMFYEAGEDATEWNIGNLSNWDTSNVTDMSYMFHYAGAYATTWNSIGTLKIYSTNINKIFNGCINAKATLKIYINPTSYSNAFTNAATATGAYINVDYTSSVTDIDNIIATKSSTSNVVKGNLFTP